MERRNEVWWVGFVANFEYKTGRKLSLQHFASLSERTPPHTSLLVLSPPPSLVYVKSLSSMRAPSLHRSPDSPGHMIQPPVLPFCTNRTAYPYIPLHHCGSANLARPFLKGGFRNMLSVYDTFQCVLYDTFQGAVYDDRNIRELDGGCFVRPT